MPQFDIFFFFNNVIFFSTMFSVLYITITWVFLPRFAKVMFLRKQKLEYLVKINWIYANRLLQGFNLNQALFFVSFSGISNFLKKNIYIF